MKIVLVEKNRAPYGVKCELCGRIAKAGQFVALKTITNFGHIVLHKACIAAMLDDIPDEIDGTLEEEYARIQRDYIEGKVFE